MSKVKVSLDNGETFVEVDRVVIEAPGTYQLGDKPCTTTITFDANGLTQEVWEAEGDQALVHTGVELWEDWISPRDFHD